MNQNTESTRYDSLDGLRTIAAIGIICMHIEANAKYAIGSVLGDRIIPSFTHLVFLFMILSGFSMSCGYYERLKNNTITLESFYLKRYQRIFPFFALLVLIDILFTHNVEALYQGFADLTLVFSLLPNPNLSIVGVGWTLGIIFLFYLLFPFMVFLLNNKKRAWFGTAIALVYNFLCIKFFCQPPYVTDNFTARKNFAYCAVYFIVGGLIFLYKKYLYEFSIKYKSIIFIICISSPIAFFLLPKRFTTGVCFTVWVVIIFSSWIIYALGSKGVILNNKFTRFFSKISFEIYLSHMIVFQLTSKVHIENYIDNQYLVYLFMVLMVIVVTIIFVECAKKGLNILHMIFHTMTKYTGKKEIK